MRHLGFSPEQAEPGRKRSDFAVIRTLLPFLWPARGIANAFEIKVRVVSAMIFIVLAKIATVYAPIFLQRAVDALAPGDGASAPAAAIPLALIVAYGGARF